MLPTKVLLNVSLNFLNTKTPPRKRLTKDKDHLSMIEISLKTHPFLLWVLTNSKMLQSISDNGKMDKDTAKVSNTGMMALSMKDTGETIWLMVKVD